MSMPKRELWHNIMYYKGHDRMPVIHWCELVETKERWIKEGMPPDANEHEYFNAVPLYQTVGGVNVNLRLPPPYLPYDYTSLKEKGAIETLEETGEYRIFKDFMGVVRKGWKKDKSGMDQYIDFTLKTAKDWDKFKERLQPDPGRIRNDLDKFLREVENADLPLCMMDCSSLMGWIRCWMGLENMSYLIYDNPDVYADMINTVAELVCWGMDQVLPKMNTKPDMGLIWEDICYKSGPLVSPENFRKYVAPGYRKIRNKLEGYGIKLLAVDSDGYVEPLIKDWLDAGVNVMFPIEPGTWNADPMKLRRKFGKELRMIGGFNKFVLERRPSEIDKEIERRMSIMEDGGYVVMPDHAITPGTSLENYKYYLERIRSLRF